MKRSKRAKEESELIFTIVFQNDDIKLRSALEAIPSSFEKIKCVNVRDGYKRTPLFYALFFNNYELVSLLLESGADTLFSDV